MSIADTLRATAAIGDLRGLPADSVSLLHRAADAIAKGEPDAAMSADLAAWALMADGQGQRGFAAILEQGSEALYPSIGRVT